MAASVEDKVKLLDQKIKALEERLEKLRNLREALSDGALAEDIAGLFASNGTIVKPAVGRPKGSKAFNKLKAAFEQLGTGPATIEELVEASGLSKSSVRQTLYRTHPDQFERESAGGGGIPTKFWLKRSSVFRQS